MLKHQPKSTKFQKSKILVLEKFTRPNDQLRVGTKSWNQEEALK